MKDITQWLEHVPAIELIVEKPLLNLYAHGSHLYGTDNDGSDWDCMVIIETDEDFTMIQEGLYDIHVYSQKEFQRKLDSHAFDVIVSFCAPIIQNVEMNFTLDKMKLRSCVSQKADHSYVKAKKKNIVEKEYYLAKKSLFHSFRIFDFGSQFAKNGCIVDFKSCKEIHDEIMLLEEGDKTWEKWNNKFKKRFNGMKSEFKILAPK